MLVVSIGEVLWDELPTGRRPGGAPANVAVHARRLGADAALISRVGDDEDGHALIDELRRAGVDTSGVQIDRGHATGTVAVALDGAGVPTFDIRDEVAWDYIEDTPQARALTARADAVCYGTLAQRRAIGAAAVHSLVLYAAREDAVRVCDVNVRRPYASGDVIARSMRVADVVKLDENELDTIATLQVLGGDETEILHRLVTSFDLELLALTRGERGSRLCSRDADTERGIDPVGVVDTVGAGDAFTAALAVGRLRGLGVAELLEFAAREAGRTCTHAGAFPPGTPARG